jgi:hypothetical protein
LVTIAVIASKKGNMNEEGEHSMIKTTFYYLVLFATLMMTIGGSVAADTPFKKVVRLYDDKKQRSRSYYKPVRCFKENPCKSGFNFDALFSSNTVLAIFDGPLFRPHFLEVCR